MLSVFGRRYSGNIDRIRRENFVIYSRVRRKVLYPGVHLLEETLIIK